MVAVGFKPLPYAFTSDYMCVLKHSSTRCQYINPPREFTSKKPELKVYRTLASGQWKSDSRSDSSFKKFSKL